MTQLYRRRLIQAFPTRTHLARSLLCIVLDTSILALLSVVLVIVITGGGVIELNSVRVRARSVENPLLIVAAVVTLRYAVRRWSPFMGIRRLPLETLTAAGLRFSCEWIPAHVARLFTRPFVGLASIGLAAFLVKVLLAWQLPGFFSGDDVEIHEMSMGALFGQQWPIWELRSAFFPMLFIYPVQRITLSLGALEPETLVLSGRVAVAFMSTAAIPLTWFAARRLAPADERLAALAVVFVTINKLHMSFGSTELPRPVSTVFVAAAFLFILRERLLSSAAAGTLLGVAAAFRFSEVVFVPAALVTLPRDRYWSRVAILLLTATVTAAVLLAASDATYWRRPFSSIVAVIDYTLLQRQSSRGYQPYWEYLRIIPSWSTYMFVAFAAVGSARRHPDSWWLWIPVILLSLLPHKESRYLIPIIPFFSIAAARGFLRAADWMRRSPAAPPWRRWTRELFAPFLLLSVLHDVGGWRLLRSNEGVRLAQYLRASGSAGVAAQDSWRLGGRPYMWQHESLVELPPALLTDTDATAAAIAGVRWVALRSRTARTLGDPMMHSLGFERDGEWSGEDYVLYVRQDRR